MAIDVTHPQNIKTGNVSWLFAFDEKESTLTVIHLQALREPYLGVIPLAQGDEGERAKDAKDGVVLDHLLLPRIVKVHHVALGWLREDLDAVDDGKLHGGRTSLCVKESLYDFLRGEAQRCIGHTQGEDGVVRSIQERHHRKRWRRDPNIKVVRQP